MLDMAFGRGVSYCVNREREKGGRDRERELTRGGFEDIAMLVSKMSTFVVVVVVVVGQG